MEKTVHLIPPHKAAKRQVMKLFPLALLVPIRKPISLVSISLDLSYQIYDFSHFVSSPLFLPWQRASDSILQSK